MFYCVLSDDGVDYPYSNLDDIGLSYRKGHLKESVMFYSDVKTN